MKAVVVTVVLCSIFLGFYCAHGAKVVFNLDGADYRSYNAFVKKLRDELSVGTTKLYDIPVLRTSSAVPSNQRFLEVDLIRFDGTTVVTIGIDVVDVYVVAFRGNNRAYFLKDASQLALQNLFKGTPQVKLTYSGSYTDLERAAGISRSGVALGLSPLDSAIGNIWFNQATSIPRSLLVIIQMLSEAARFRLVEVRINMSIQRGENYIPTIDVLSVENNWSALSSAIRQSTNGKFKTTVTIQNVRGEAVSVNSVNDAKSLTGISLILNGRS